MLPMFCFSCHMLLGDKQLYYERELEKICKDQEMGKYKSIEDSDNDKIKLVNSLGLRRLCCKQTVITYVQLIKIIK